MLQSIKRAHKLDASHPKLHSCLIRFYEFIDQSREGWDPAIEEVVRQEAKALFEDKDAKQLNRDFLERHASSLEHVLEGAKMMHYLDPENQGDALGLVTNLDNKYHDVNIQVGGLVGVGGGLTWFSFAELRGGPDGAEEGRVGPVRVGRGGVHEQVPYAVPIHGGVQAGEHRAQREQSRRAGAGELQQQLMPRVGDALRDSLLIVRVLT